MADRLTGDAVAAALARLPGWTREGDAVVKEFRFDGFAAAIAFVVAVGFAAERADHHPDIDIRWNRVRLLLTTHDAGGLTTRDVALAEHIERIAEGDDG